MTELLTAAQMRAIEQAAIDSGEVTGLELMERAGRGVVEAIFEEWPELAKTSYRAVVLCGPGNNGGDGFVVARLLKEWGWEVEVFLYGDGEKLPADAKVNCERWAEMGEVQPLTDVVFDGYAEDHPDTFLAVDALFGTGFVRPFLDLGRVQMELNTYENMSRFGDFPHVVSVDVPSGLCSDSGQYLGIVQENPFDSSIMANLTVSFHSEKVGHRIADGPVGSGKVVVKGIGLSHKAGSSTLHRLSTLTTPRLVAKWGRHKYSHGHALILSGPPGQGGAARLAARGALRIGAGLVTVGSPTEAIPEHAAQLNAIMVRPMDRAEGLAGVLEDARISSLCLGPGLGLTEATKEMVEVALKSQRKLVLDADALSIYAGDEAKLFALCHADVVLTPHGGEFARLFPDIAEKLNAPAIKGPAYSKVDAARAAAARAGCVVLFKGADTVIAAPDGCCSINSAHYERAAPWLATAGSGDVLAGFIAGLMARGFAPMQAAETAAWLHVECARSFGPGLIAEDLPDQLPKVFRQLKV